MAVIIWEKQDSHEELKENQRSHVMEKIGQLEGEIPWEGRKISWKEWFFVLARAPAVTNNKFRYKNPIGEALFFYRNSLFVGRDSR